MSANDRRCRSCGGDVVIVLRRAWCVQRYDLGGCGGHWVQRDGKWSRA